MKFMFDCDDTLYELIQPFKMAMRDFFPEISENFLEMYVCYRNAGDVVFDQVQKHLITIDEAGEYRISEMCKKYHIPITEEQISSFQKKYRYYQGKITMHPCLEEFFKNSKSTLAILTNGQDAHQKMKVRALHVYDYVEASHIFTSDELNVAKPDPNAFKKAVDRMDGDVASWFYIGDNYDIDMIGAKRAGMKTIHINRNHKNEGPMSDYLVYTDEELVALLYTLEGKE